VLHKIGANLYYNLIVLEMVLPDSSADIFPLYHILALPYFQ